MKLPRKFEESLSQYSFRTFWHPHPSSLPTHGKPALAILGTPGGPSACSATITSLAEGCQKKIEDGFYPMRIQTHNDKVLFPEIYCQDQEITILTRNKTKESSFRDKPEILFNYNQGRENYTVLVNMMVVVMISMSTSKDDF